MSTAQKFVDVWDLRETGYFTLVSCLEKFSAKYKETAYDYKRRRQPTTQAEIVKAGEAELKTIMPLEYALKRTFKLIHGFRWSAEEALNRFALCDFERQHRKAGENCAL